MNRIYAKTVKRVLLSTFIVLFSMVSFATTYYVSNIGSDANSGLTTTLAWKSLAKVNATTFNAGDQILLKRGDTWRETLTINQSGTDAQRIVISNYGTGNKPRILGSNTVTSWENQGSNIWKSSNTLLRPYGLSNGNVFFINTDGTIGTGIIKASTAELTAQYNWYWTGNYIYVYSTSNPATAYTGIEVAQKRNGIFLTKKNFITIDGIDVFYNIGVGIHDGQSNPTVAQEGMTVKNCEIGYIAYPNVAEGFGISLTVSNSLVENNVIHDCGRRGVSIGLWSNVTVSNIVIQNNTFYHGYHTTSVDLQADAGAGIVENIYIRKNIVYESPTFSTVSSPVYIFLSQQSAGAATVRNIQITDNIFKYPANQCVQIDKVTTACVYNNTFYGHTEVSGKTSKFLYITNGCTNVKVKNNIFYSQLTYDTNDAGVTFYLTSTQNRANIESDYNIYYRVNPNLLLIHTDGTYARYASKDSTTIRSAYGWETHSKFVDPKVKSATDLSFQPNSKAINAGVNVGLTTDYNGNPIVGLPDIGALESGNSTPSDVIVPIVSAFIIPSTASSLTVSISTFTATDNIGVTGYLLTETSSAPSATAAGWSSTKPITYNFPTIGTKTLYAWAKDAAGNVSTSRNAGVIISSSTDVTVPVVSAFTIPSTASSLTVSISTFTTTDNIGVTGYLLTETSSAPSATAAGWSSTKPITYNFPTIGTKTLYAWAKDAAGNVSASRNDAVNLSYPVASTFTFTGPSSGNVNSESTNFTVTPNNLYTGTITITTMGIGSAGLSKIVLTFSNTSTAQSFSITPTVAGSITLTVTNSGRLINPTSLTYTAINENVDRANLGYNVKGTSVYGSGAGAMNASQFTAGSSFTATTMYVSMAAVNSKIKGAIYSDNGGSPGKKLAETSAITPSVGGFQKLTGLNVSIVSGTKYWLVVWGSEAFKIDCEPTGGIFKWKSANTYSNWWESWYQRYGYLPSTFPTPDASSGIKCSIYVDGGLKGANLNESTMETTGIEDFKEMIKIDVFPNPSAGRVTVQFSSLPEAGGRIDILDISGRKVASRIITENTELFDLENLPAGLYLVKSILGHDERVQKLIINKK